MWPRLAFSCGGQNSETNPIVISNDTNNATIMPSKEKPPLRMTEYHGALIYTNEIIKKVRASEALITPCAVVPGTC